MGIFVGAALAGFLLFGSIKDILDRDDKSQELRLQKLRLQCVLGLSGLLALFVLTLYVIFLTTQWPSYEVFRLVQDLTGHETAQFILGAAFGCILRYWGSDLWALKIATWPRYNKFNWVAISLAGLILLAAAIPYMEQQLGGMTALKTPVAEFQFASQGRTEPPALEKDLQFKVLTYLETLQFMAFSHFSIKKDLEYLEIFPEDESEKYTEIYQKSQSFAENILKPLGDCALNAYMNYLDIESIRHALQPIAQKLYLLIQQGESILELQPHSSSPTEDLDGRQKERLLKSESSWYSLRMEFLDQITKSGLRLQEALLDEGEKKLCKLEPQWEPQVAEFPKPEELVAAPNTYLVLAYLDAFNHNMDRSIDLLKSASQRFSNRAPVVSFNINFSLALFLNQEGKYDLKSIFLYLDNAREIAQKAWGKIKDSEANSKDYYYLEQYEMYAKNFLAYVSAQEGVRKFEALQYAKHNYAHRNKLHKQSRPKIIDTYGYVKMAFEARKSFPNFDEIVEARALFKEAISHQENLYKENLVFLDKHASAMKVLREHLEQANNLLKYRHT